MKYLAIVSAIGSLICGLRAAWLWRSASVIDILPSRVFEKGGDPTHNVMGHLVPTMEALKKGAELNKLAAAWTAAAVFFSILATLFGL